MIIEVAAVAVEVGLAIAMAAADVAVLILAASIRPWRYVLSPGFRETTARELAGRHPLYRAAYFAWGSVALLASVGVVVGIWWFISSLPPSPPPLPSKLETKVQNLRERASDLKEGLKR
ncbi:hypothetical protein DSM104443_00296 [Usitatibacter rugosus]|uniref:Transmembrane protein n=1 Tax=Usitatibacter rugosus TaxID=2732067 RepID=A0A6M4GPJ8_9PROT|nr:hypothetical protein [Usitatibacter rugosus]QJR09259.1 hypothetical protein DSM104443_00296 [Usitatibacter rugosus]